MNSFSNNTKKTKTQVRGSLFEQMRDLGSGLVKTAVSETGKIGSGVLNQMISGPRPPVSAPESRKFQKPLSPERFPWRREKIAPPKLREIQVFSFAERQEQIQTRLEIKRLVEEIKREIVLLEKKQKVMIAEAAKVTVQTLPEKPGVYHLRFFEWLLKLLKDLRKRVSESATWLSVLRSKKKQKTYWRMYKKQGTKFGLSGERAVATQAG